MINPCKHTYGIGTAPHPVKRRKGWLQDVVTSHTGELFHQASKPWPVPLKLAGWREIAAPT
jgi:hypothetical protein